MQLPQLKGSCGSGGSCSSVAGGRLASVRDESIDGIKASIEEAIDVSVKGKTGRCSAIEATINKVAAALRLMPQWTIGRCYLYQWQLFNPTVR